MNPITHSIEDSSEKHPLSFKEIIFFHNTMDQLHEYVDRDILPEEYGGKLARVENTQVRLASLKFEDYFKEVQKMADDNRDRF